MPRAGSSPVGRGGVEAIPGRASPACGPPCSAQLAKLETEIDIKTSGEERR